jgi:hypothetical protein
MPTIATAPTTMTPAVRPMVLTTEVLRHLNRPAFYHAMHAVACDVTWTVETKVVTVLRDHTDNAITLTLGVKRYTLRVDTRAAQELRDVGNDEDYRQALAQHGSLLKISKPSSTFSGAKDPPALLL